MSDYLWPHGLQHARLPCPSPSPRACYSYPLSWWCYPLSWWCHLIPCGPLLLLPSIFSRIRVFFNESGSQSIGASASASVLPKNIQDWFPWGLTGLISLQCKGFPGVFSNTTVQKLQFFGSQLPYGATLTSIHDYWKKHTVGSILLGKPEQTRQWTSKLFSPETMTPFPWILSALFSSLFPRLVARALPKFYSWECPELEKVRRLLHDVAS